MNPNEPNQSWEHWFRLLWILLFFFLLYYALKIITAVIALTQFICVLLNGEPLQRLQDFSGRLNRYSFQILQYMTFNEDRKPFPFSEFPESE